MSCPVNAIGLKSSEIQVAQTKASRYRAIGSVAGLGAAGMGVCVIAAAVASIGLPMILAGACAVSALGLGFVGISYFAHKEFSAFAARLDPDGLKEKALNELMAERRQNATLEKKLNRAVIGLQIAERQIQQLEEECGRAKADLQQIESRIPNRAEACQQTEEIPSQSPQPIRTILKTDSASQTCDASGGLDVQPEKIEEGSRGECEQRKVSASSEKRLANRNAQALQQQIQKLTSQVERTASELQRVKEDADKKNQDAQEQVRHLTDRLSQTTLQLKNATNEKDQKLLSQHEKIEAEFSRVKTKLQAEKDAATRKVRSFQQQIEKLKSQENAALQKVKEEADKKNQIAQEQIQKLTNELAQITLELQNMRNEKKIARFRCCSMKK